MAEHGHTVIELMVVIAIMLCVSAMAIPTVVNVVATAKLRSGMHNLTTLFQNGRTQAVKQNSIKSLNFTVKDGRVVAYVDSAANPEGLTADAITTVNGVAGTQSQIYLPIAFTKVSTPTGSDGAPPALTATTMWGSSASDYTAITTDPMYFNQVGLPCAYSAGVCPVTNPAGTGYVYYFNYATSLGKAQWAAIGISPAGRIKSWYWNGSAWSD